jgi:hypothetical protein
VAKGEAKVLELMAKGYDIKHIKRFFVIFWPVFCIAKIFFAG